ncbi:MAG: DUF2461 domain-containing protein [Acidobacteria bacterium]|nr:DUF2461 domain-containing protein [Acidobacteriota bacterium]
MPAFSGFPREGIAFLRDLKKHNTREWFQPRKALHDELVKKPMVDLIAAMQREMAEFAPQYTGEPRKLIYRIYRDTRFSADKTPYKTNIAASFAPRGAERHAAAGFYFSISPVEVAAGSGVYMPQPPQLLAIRGRIAERHLELRAILAERTLRRLMGGLDGEQLSRVPKGFPAEHPAADLLRYKQLLLYVTLDAGLATTPKLYTELIRRFRAMTPFVEFLNGR